MGNLGQKIGLVVDAGGGTPASIDIYINEDLFAEDQSTDIDIAVVDSADTPMGSNVGGDWEIPDNTYEVSFNGTQVASGSAAANEDINIAAFL